MLVPFTYFKPAASGYTPFLENISVTPEFAWSVWQPHSTVTSCVRLRRDSDNAERDFGYDSNGYVDTASITSWASGANLFVVTFYSYSRNATESTSSNQVKWNNTGGIDNQACFDRSSLSTLNVMRYSLSSNIPSIVDYDLLKVTSVASSTGNTNYTLSTFNGARGYIVYFGSSLRTRPDNSIIFGGIGLGATPEDTVLEINRTGGTAEAFRDKSTLIGTGSNADNDTITRLLGQSDFSQAEEYESELIFFKSKLGTTDRNQYYSDYNTRYNKSI